MVVPRRSVRGRLWKDTRAGTRNSPGYFLLLQAPAYSRLLSHQQAQGPEVGRVIVVIMFEKLMVFLLLLFRWLFRSPERKLRLAFVVDIIFKDMAQ